MQKFSIFFLLLFCCFPSCELNDESIGEEEFTSAQSIDLLQPSIAQMVYNQSAMSGRTVALVMQYLDQIYRADYWRKYAFIETYFNVMWSDGFYGGSLSSATEMKRLASEAREDDLVAIALILLAQELSTLTNMFGDIPFREALQGENNPTPSYDTQQDIYAAIINMLDEAIEIMGNPTSNQSIANDDLIYGGEMQGWKKLAYGLKARTLLNQRNKIAENDSEILALLENSFQNREEQADFPFDASFTNPQFDDVDTRTGNRGIGEYFENLLLMAEDPRASTYFFNGSQSVIFGGDALKWYRREVSIPVLSYTELLFMRTEILYHTGADQNEIGTALHAALTSSMIDNEVDIDSSTISFLTATSDLNGLNSIATLERIMEQTYISYYGFNHLQAWNNYRRTGYPDLPSTANGTNEHNPSNGIPRRFIYPLSEFSYNADKVQEALARQGGGLMDNDIWIFE